MCHVRPYGAGTAASRPPHTQALYNMIKFLLLLLLFFAAAAKATFKIPPYVIFLKESDKFGISVQRVVEEKFSHIYVRIDETKLCPVESVSLQIMYPTVGSKSLHLDKINGAYTATFPNHQEYDSVAYLINCSKMSAHYEWKQFLFVLGQ